jgi:hypothetical protein
MEMRFVKSVVQIIFRLSIRRAEGNGTKFPRNTCEHLDLVFS